MPSLVCVFLVLKGFILDLVCKDISIEKEERSIKVNPNYSNSFDANNREIVRAVQK